MNTIESRSNPIIKQIVQLHQAKYRAEYNQCIGEGLRTCATLMQGYELDMLYVTPDQINEAQSLADDAHITIVNAPIMKKISALSSPPGMLGVFTIPASLPLAEMTTPVVILAQISDPGNMGTLIRTAAAMRVSSVVIIEGADCWSPKVIQATAGTIAFATVFKTTWNSFLSAAHAKNFTVTGLVVEGGSSPSAISWKSSALVIGNEARGISADWIKACDTTITLPMPGQVESLNAAVAGSIALYLIAHQT